MLRPGDIVIFEGRRHVVTMVNESRAVLVPVEKEVVQIRTAFGREVQFSRYRPGISVSPESELDVIDRAYPTHATPRKPSRWPAANAQEQTPCALPKQTRFARQ